MVTRRSRLILLVVGVAAAGIIAVAAGRGASHRVATGGSAGNTSTLAVGATAPTAMLSSTRGDVVNLADFRGKRNVMLYFYEHAG